MEKVRVEIMIEVENGSVAQALREAWRATLESLRTATVTISVQAPVH